MPTIYIRALSQLVGVYSVYSVNRINHPRPRRMQSPRIICLLALLFGRANTQWGNGIKTGCTQGSTCQAGCYGSVYNCYQCGIGFYKGSGGLQACDACRANSGSNCATCMSGYGDCWCNAGYGGTMNGPCNACVVGKYKTPKYGSPYSCSSCSAGTYAPTTGASACTSCPASTTSGTTAATCTCPSGSTDPNNGPCTVCDAGKYKDTVSSLECTSCPAGTYSTAVGASVMSTCVACEAGYTVPVGSTSSVDCVLPPYIAGMTGPDGGPCANCTGGTFKSTAGSAACVACVSPTYSLAGAATWTACPDVRQGSYGLRDGLNWCKCPAGWYGDGGACVACPAGTYKKVVSGLCYDCAAGTSSTAVGASVMSTCGACGADTYARAGSSACVPCGVGWTSVGGGGPESCECAPGFEFA
jgi:hypothetical protein